MLNLLRVRPNVWTLGTLGIVVLLAQPMCNRAVPAQPLRTSGNETDVKPLMAQPPRADGDEADGPVWVASHFSAARQKCVNGDPAACQRLSNRLQYPTNGQELRDHGKALAGGCSKGVQAACASAAWAVLLDEDGSHHADAVQQLERLCRDGIAAGCAYLGEALFRKDAGFKADPVRGAHLVEETCAHTGGAACWNAAAILVANGHSEGDREVQRLRLRACDGGDATACYELSLVFSSVGSDGPRIVPADDTKAFSLANLACEQDMALACDNLGWMLKDGRGTVRDPTRAQGAILNACRLGDAKACDDLSEAGSLSFKSACSLWGAAACYSAVAKLVEARGEVAEVAEEAIDMLLKGCNRGNHASCNTLGHALKDDLRECGANVRVRDTCAWAGIAAERKLELPGLNAGDSQSFLQRSCQAGAASVCTKLNGPSMSAQGVGSAARP